MRTYVRFAADLRPRHCVCVHTYDSPLTYAQGIVARHEAEIGQKWADLLREGDDSMQEEGEQEQAEADQRETLKLNH